MTQAHVYYSGVVQGVGFRFTVQRLAGLIGGMTGWVRNLDDGRVEILVEGPVEGIERLLNEIEQRFDGSISDKNITYGLQTGVFPDFRIMP